MCLMLYMGTSIALPPRREAALSIEEVDSRREAVRQWFSLPTVSFIGAHTGCSCGFPSVISEVPIEYFDGMFPEIDEERAADLRSVAALITLLKEVLKEAPHVELYPVAHGEEAAQPKGAIELALESIEPEQFFFNERFMHVVRASRPPSTAKLAPGAIEGAEP